MLEKLCRVQKIPLSLGNQAELKNRTGLDQSRVRSILNRCTKLEIFTPLDTTRHAKKLF